MITLTRIDNRLIHGQVIETWLPHLGVKRILVVDDQAAGNPLTRAAMGLAVPERIPVELRTFDQADLASAESAPEPTLLLVRDVAGVLQARERGLRCRQINVGNVHFAPGRKQVTTSVFLDGAEVQQLKELATAGMQVEVRAIPKDKPLGLAEVEARTS